MSTSPWNIYRESLALFTDLYQLTMAYGYWKKGLADREAVFHLFFRKWPFKGSFALAAGLETAIQFIREFRFEKEDLSYLRELRGEDGKPFFDAAFLDYLKNFSFQIDLDAVPEGTPVFPYEPLLRVKAPILQAQLLESPLLNIINFQTLIATKASRVCWAARPDPVVEFGMRRAQGIDGALSASRAAYIGGCESTSHVLAGKVYGIPVRGTQAHSWIMAFDDEKDSFRAYAEALPNNCLFLVDTYDSIKGTKLAIELAKELKAKGVKMVGVRLDSGDLAQLSIAIREILDREGFKDAKIMASNELDEWLIADLKHQGAKIDMWGVGTNLVTAKDQPALDGVYKLSAIKSAKGEWQQRIKISEQLAKATTPGILQVRRFFDQGINHADMIYDESRPLPSTPCIVDPFETGSRLSIEKKLSFEDLLKPIFRGGKCVYSMPPLSLIREYALLQQERFAPSIRRLLNPQTYFRGLEKSLHELKLALIEEVVKRGI